MNRAVLPDDDTHSTVKVVQKPLDASGDETPTATAPTKRTPESERSRPPETQRSRAFPAPGWDRYEPGEFIGEGAMGRVYKALDPRLRRVVALKFLRSDDPDKIRRFIREARTQASIDHAHICKVHEVGEVLGMPYIAMAYIEGESLKAAKKRMTLEQKVKVMALVSAALHAAHRIGLIHRDIKPSNIMVAPSEDAGLHPYILDFGLAREVAAPSETAVGLIEGTPSYMAPEQVVGDDLDRRTDVYSLGATLYELLCGRPPFVGPTTLDILQAVVSAEPAPPGKLAPGTPADLETIALKCLEKEPSRRYDSAKALAEDLERYLDGEPIKARPPSFGYVAVKKARKHKALVAVSAAALLALIVVGAMGIRARRSAAEQAELAQALGQDVKEIELLMRYAYALPVHDVGREKARVRQRMADIEARMAKAGALALGPGHYALGRGHLALHEPDKARAHLEQAWEAGYRRPEVDYALGLSLGELYKSALEEAQRIADKDARLGRTLAIEKEYLEPALQHLRSRGGAEQVESPAYVEGLIALYSKRYDEALQKVAEAMDQSLWRYEVRKLEGDVRAALGNEKRDHGEGEGALREYTRAADAYRDARETARSDATIHEAECEMWVQVLELEAGKGENPKASLDKALHACDEAQQASPESAGAYSKKAWAHGRWGKYLWEQKQDPRAALEKSIELGKEALRIHPEDPSTYDTLGNAHEVLAEVALLHDEDPREPLSRAAENFEQALKLHPTFAWAWNDLGTIYLLKGDYEAGHGIDPRASFDRSIERLSTAIQTNPGYHIPYANKAYVYVLKAQHELRSGVAPGASAEQAEASAREALAINPTYELAHDMLGMSFLVRAEYELESGRDPEAFAGKAESAFSASLASNASAFYPHLYLVLTSRVRANYLLRTGADPAGPIDRATREQAKMAAQNPEDADTHLSRAHVALLAARWSARRGDKRSLRDFEQAEQAADKAVQTNAGDVEIFVVAADVGRWKAVFQVRHKKPARETLAKALSMVDRGLSMNPSAAALLEIKGALSLLEAKAEKNSAAQHEAASRGQAQVDEALQRNPLLRWEHSWMLEELRGAP